MKYRRKNLARRITLAAGAALMSGTLLFGSSYSFAMAQETDSQALDENTAGDTGTSSGNADTSSGDAGTSSGDADTSSGDAGTSQGDTDTTSGDADTSSGDTDTSSGDTDTSSEDSGASSGDADTSSEDTGASLGTPNAPLGNTGALSEKTNAPNALMSAPADDKIEISDWATLQKYFNTGSSGDYVLTADLHQGPNDSSLHLNTPAQHSERKNRYFILDLNGHTIQGSGGGAVIKIDAGNRLSIRDYSDEQTGKITGGADLIAGGILNDGDLVVENITITGNRSLTGGGGITNNSETTLRNVKITGNEAGAGGGVYNGSKGAVLNINDGIISGNTVFEAGGGIVARAGSEITISGNVNVTGNTTSNGKESNVFLGDGVVINDSGIGSEARLGITTEKSPSSQTIPITGVLHAKEHANAFFSEIPGAKIEVNESRVAVLYTDSRFRYKNTDGTLKDSYNTIFIDSGTTQFENNKWYGVNSDVTVNDRIKVNGNVNLILGDGAVLNAAKGITVEAGSSLTIWGQQEETGKLISKSVEEGRTGIGSGSRYAAPGDITINGGNIEAVGSRFAAGIGSASKACSRITINGGNVKVTGGESGAGIGNGSNADAGGVISITGGTVSATGGYDGAGIGSGLQNPTRKDPPEIIISGGNVTAKGGVFGAGIGGGFNANGGKVTISGGVVNTTGGTGAAFFNYYGGGAGIGGGAMGNGGNVRITEGHVNAIGTDGGKGIGQGGRDVDASRWRNHTEGGVTTFSYRNYWDNTDDVEIEIYANSYGGKLFFENSSFKDRNTGEWFAWGEQDINTMGGRTLIPGPQHAIYVEQKGDGGKVEVSRSSADPGETVYVYATPKSYGWQAKVTYDAKSVPVVDWYDNKAGTYAFKMPKADVTVYVEWIFDDSPQGEESKDTGNNAATSDTAGGTPVQQSPAAVSYSSAAPVKLSSAPHTGDSDVTPVYIIIAAGATAGLAAGGIFMWRKKKC